LLIARSPFSFFDNIAHAIEYRDQKSKEIRSEIFIHTRKVGQKTLQSDIER